MLSLVHPRRFSRKRTAWVFLCLPRGARTLAATKRRGYRMGHMDAIENIREELQSATAEERDQLKREVLQMFGM